MIVLAILILVGYLLLVPAIIATIDRVWTTRTSAQPIRRLDMRLVNTAGGPCVSSSDLAPGADFSERRNGTGCTLVGWVVCRRWMLRECSGGAKTGCLSVFVTRFGSRWMSLIGI